MFNTEEIIELEKKWFKYKIKQKSKLYIFMLLIITILFSITYTIYFPEQLTIITQTAIEKTDKKPEIKTVQSSKKATQSVINNSIKNKNTIVMPIESNASEKQIIEIEKVIIKKDNSKPYHFKLEPTDQGSELFSSNGFLTLNLKYSDKKQDITTKEKYQIVQPIREIQTNISKQEIPKQKVKISIDMQEIDTIAYLKDKYYSTSSIVFALMLAEEYYYEKKYIDSLKWSLTANDIDSQNAKSWYWFAKSKVKLNQKEDATRALKAYLSNNNSKRLSTLLHKIKLGDTDD